MKKRFLILLCVLISAGAIFNPVANAVDFQIVVGDRPYYQGADFWDWGWHWVWVPGHWYRHRWIHGYYERRGDWNHRYLRSRHSWRHYDNEHHHHHHHD